MLEGWAERSRDEEEAKRKNQGGFSDQLKAMSTWGAVLMEEW